FFLQEMMSMIGYYSHTIPTRFVTLKNRTVSRTVPQNSKVFSDWQIIQTPSYSLRCVRAGRYDFGYHFSFVSEWQ
ncbi:hypothetical protein KA005_12620, partial [bacterium]|nr:hypothetical protein [bacterium]